MGINKEKIKKLKEKKEDLIDRVNYIHDAAELASLEQAIINIDNELKSTKTKYIKEI